MNSNLPGKDDKEEARRGYARLNAKDWYQNPLNRKRHIERAKSYYYEHRDEINERRRKKRLIERLIIENASKMPVRKTA